MKIEPLDVFDKTNPISIKGSNFFISNRYYITFLLKQKMEKTDFNVVNSLKATLCCFYMFDNEYEKECLYCNDNSYVITQEYFKEKNLVTFLDDFNKYINVIYRKVLNQVYENENDNSASHSSSFRADYKIMNAVKFYKLQTTSFEIIKNGTAIGNIMVSTVLHKFSEKLAQFKEIKDLGDYTLCFSPSDLINKFIKNVNINTNGRNKISFTFHKNRKQIMENAYNNITIRQTSIYVENLPNAQINHVINSLPSEIENEHCNSDESGGCEKCEKCNKYKLNVDDFNLDDINFDNININNKFSVTELFEVSDIVLLIFNYISFGIEISNENTYYIFNAKNNKKYRIIKYNYIAPLNVYISSFINDIDCCNYVGNLFNFHKIKYDEKISIML
jgi:hypothetical protein